jgi:hypothetical protein
LFFYPNTRRLGVIDGDGGSANNVCGDGEGKDGVQMVLVQGEKSTVRIASRQNRIDVYIDGELECSEPREHTQTFANAHVYASDPWYAPADAAIDNFYMRPLTDAPPPPPSPTDDGNLVQDIRACEGSTVSITCEAGMIQIVDAEYGRMHGADVCPSAATSDQNCHAVNAVDIVQTECEGKHACEIAASNAIFGDPCGGTHKYLTVNYVCGNASWKIGGTNSVYPGYGCLSGENDQHISDYTLNPCQEECSAEAGCHSIDW